MFQGLEIHLSQAIFSILKALDDVSMKSPLECFLLQALALN
jgi:hypothetical protein